MMIETGTDFLIELKVILNETETDFLNFPVNKKIKIKIINVNAKSDRRHM
jgi:hypothetical protein